MRVSTMARAAIPASAYACLAVAAADPDARHSRMRERFLLRVSSAIAHTAASSSTLSGSRACIARIAADDWRRSSARVPVCAAGERGESAVRRTAVARRAHANSGAAAGRGVFHAHGGDRRRGRCPDADFAFRSCYHFLAEAHDVTFFRTKRAQAARQQAQWERYEKAFDVLRRWGLATLGELGACRRANCRRGWAGRRALQRCAAASMRGRSCPDPGVPRFLQRIELEWPIDTLEPLSFVFARLLDPLSAALERADRGAAALRLDLRLVDRTDPRAAAAVAGGDARSEGAAHVAGARSRIASALSRHRSRHHRSRSRAGPHCSILAARTGACRQRKHWRR